MMVIVLKDFDTKEEIARLKAKKLPRLFDATQVISGAQEEEDILGLGYTCRVCDAGITSYVTRGVVMATESTGSETVCYPSRNTSVFGAVAVGDLKPPMGVRILREGGTEEETGLRLSVTAYPEGYVLSTGKKASNIFGQTSDAYMKSIGKRNVRSCGISGCRIFPTLKNLLAFVEKNYDVLEYMAKEYGYSFSYMEACEEFRQQISLSPLTAGEEKAGKALQELLRRINNANESMDDAEDLTGTAGDAEMREECLSRLEKLGVVGPVTRDFKRNRLYMSEFGGVLYNLDVYAKEAVAAVSGDGHMAYAVVCNQAKTESYYTVLFVSRERSSWPAERPDKNGDCLAYVYVPDAPANSEYGSVCIQGANGGLIRTA